VKMEPGCCQIYRMMMPPRHVFSVTVDDDARFEATARRADAMVAAKQAAFS